jgi:hypothetical protein
MGAIGRFLRGNCGETTVSGVIMALVMAMGLMILVNISMFIFSSIQVYQAKIQGDRAMYIQGGFNDEVLDVIESNLQGHLDLSRVSINATPYPINRGDPYSLVIQYDYPFGLIGWSENTSLNLTVTTIPIRSHAYGLSEAVLR